MLEMDVCLTKDQEVLNSSIVYLFDFLIKIVVLHDPTLDRLCGINKHISKFNYQEIPQFLEKTFLHFSINQYFDTNATKTKYMPKLEVLIINKLMNI